jgi:RNA polymerase sigma-70 factor (ECF subfamily)
VQRDEETQLARALQLGSAQAFEAFVDHFGTKVFHYSWLMCGQREDAEEVAQETLLAVFRNLANLREPERVRAWVFQIAKNACLVKRRKSVFAPSRELSLDEYLPARKDHNGQSQLELADWSGLPEDKVLKSELQHVISDAIRGLPENYRTVMLLRDVEELSTQETAQILDISDDVVKTRLHRARLAIRKKLDEYLRTSGASPVKAG